MSDLCSPAVTFAWLSLATFLRGWALVAHCTCRGLDCISRALRSQRDDLKSCIICFTVAGHSNRALPRGRTTVCVFPPHGHVSSKHVWLDPQHLYSITDHENLVLATSPIAPEGREGASGPQRPAGSDGLWFVVDFSPQMTR